MYISLEKSAPLKDPKAKAEQQTPSKVNPRPTFTSCRAINSEREPPHQPKMSSKRSHASICQLDTDNAIETAIESSGNYDHLGMDSFASFRTFLLKESHPLYECGRAYLSNLTKWRKYLHRRGDNSLCATPSSPLPNDSLVARPDENPELLIQWRAQMIEYFIDFVDSHKHLQYHRHTALVALSYLDTFSMMVCFSEEWSRRKQEGGDIRPSPAKKRKDHNLADDDDYLYEHCSQQDTTTSFVEDAVNGMGLEQYELAAITSLYISSKVNQSANGVHSSIGFSKLYRTEENRRKYSTKEIEKMELEILNALGCHVHVPTSLVFIQEMLPLLITDQEQSNPFALDASPWIPQRNVEKSIYFCANYLAQLACCGADKYPSIVSAKPSQIALASIVESAGRILYNEKRLLELHEIQQRLYSQNIIQYDSEVQSIQKCLVELKRLNEGKVHSARRGASPTTVTETPTESTNESTTTPSRSYEDEENLQIESSKKSANPAAPSRAGIHHAVSRSSKTKGSSTQKKCSEGRKHRTWERTEQWALDATAASRSFVSEEMHATQDLEDA